MTVLSAKVAGETMIDLEQALLKNFGFSTFFGGQREIIERVLSGQHTLAILATGAGKSLCYQLPALLLEGTTVVVSPLIALMKDQLDMLSGLGISDVVALNSSLSEEEEKSMLSRVTSGSVKLLFVTPERLEDANFVALLGQLKVPLFVVDEAHCISAWGHDFRPAYLALGQVVKRLGSPTLLALTATATPAVRDDILHQLGIPQVKPIVRGFDRPGLRYEVFRAEHDSDKLSYLKKIFRESPNEPAIIYTATIKNALLVQHALRETCENPVGLYHSRLQKNERIAMHELFMNDAVRIVVATNAFGLGIDKPNIRYVIHYDLPGSLEAYVQEAGRAGRDGNPSRCIMLYRTGDTRVQKYFLNGKYPSVEDIQRVYRTFEYFMQQAQGVSVNDLRKIVQLPISKLRIILASLKRAGIIMNATRSHYQLSPEVVEKSDHAVSLISSESKRAYDQSKLEMMLQYAESSSCRRRFILNYFGEEDLRETCGSCDNCLRRTVHVRRAEPESHPHHATFRISQQVLHPRFGEGSVERVERDLVTVLFPDIGYKTLLASAVVPAALVGQ